MPDPTAVDNIISVLIAATGEKIRDPNSVKNDQQASIERRRDAQGNLQLYDTSGGDKIEVNKLGQVLRSAGLNPTQSEVHKVERDLGKTTVSFEEFLPIYNSVAQHMASVTSKATPEQIVDCFKHFDRDGAGTISSSMLRHVLTSLGERLTDEEFDVLTSGHVSSKGEINYEVFVPVIMSNADF
ncbi:PREDICTED: myosin-2 essential light chain-like [Acropora digitifera]|uniref:myosin-2 essential light chain-like n=1 Tax=Acropora digitifera TaxID=70779 RepID=UPI00077AA601|nr:PREDICTED: myosin-2 essential light chain-like [Acropora digitifera]